MDEKQIRIKKDIIEIGKQMYKKGLVVGTDGNISARIDENTILITGSGFCKGKLAPEDISRVTLNGVLLDGPKPARDIRMHLAVYREKKSAAAVVHAHPPIITGYSMSELVFDKIALPEVMFNLKGIAITDYATPISIEVARGVVAAMRKNQNAECILLANHGALTFGGDVSEAFYKMETLELFAQANLVSKLLGRTRYLSKAQTDNLNRLLNGENPDDIVPLMEGEIL